ncbi:hypothetical protein TNCV_290361 [Trichonephila clavipes]|nr:hypothetical protein TNCV_290361 [Trichonephila clavipes]
MHEIIIQGLYPAQLHWIHKRETQLRHGVHPPTTESVKGGSVPAIWQKPVTTLAWSTARLYCYSISVRIQRINRHPIYRSTNPTAVSLRGHRREVPPALARLELTPVTRLQ